LKIVIFGLTVSSSWGNGHATPYRALLRALHRMGHRAVFYERDVPYYAKRRDFTSADFCELVLYSRWEDVRSRAQADASDADVVIHASYCVEGARIIDDLADVSGSLRVFYDLDTPITIEKLTAGNAEYLRADQIPHFDLYLSWCGGKLLHELEQRWHARKALPLYGCVDPDVHQRVAVPEQYRCLMSYMGTYAADRQQKVEALFLDAVRRRPDDTFVLAGSMYPEKIQWPPNLQHFEHVSPHDHPALYSSSRFTLNITRDAMSRGGFCPSGRLFEAAACGTPIISDWSTGLDHFFQSEEEVFIVRDTEDVLCALDASDEQLSRMARRARERTLAENSGECRAAQLIGYLEDAMAHRRAVAEVA
jgi:spore maturation protein CgeB